MANLIRMDLYRMRKNKGFWVCLILTLLLAIAEQPFMKLLTDLGAALAAEVSEGEITIAFPKTHNLSEIVSKPFPILSALFVLLSASGFFYADAENGFIKNIAGQMPKRGYTILSKFLAIIAHNLLFLLVCVAGKVIGTMTVQTVVADELLMKSIGIFAIKLLLLQGICSILLLVDSAFQNKALGTVLAALLGLGILSLIYASIDLALDQLFKSKNFAIRTYMPDQMLSDGLSSFKVIPGIIAGAVTIGVFLPLSIRVFDHRDVK